MMKNLLLAASVVIATAANAQSGKIAKPLVPPVNMVQLSNSQSVLPASCFSLSTITGTGVGVGGALSDTQTAGCSPNAGYVLGSNCYKDQEKANAFGPN